MIPKELRSEPRPLCLGRVKDLGVSGQENYQE